MREFVIEKLRVSNKFQKLTINSQESEELLLDNQDLEDTITIPFQSADSDSDDEVGVVYKTYKKVK